MNFAPKSYTCICISARTLGKKSHANAAATKSNSPTAQNSNLPKTPNLSPSNATANATANAAPPRR